MAKIFQKLLRPSVLINPVAFIKTVGNEITGRNELDPKLRLQKQVAYSTMVGVEILSNAGIIPAEIPVMLAALGAGPFGFLADLVGLGAEETGFLAGSLAAGKIASFVTGVGYDLYHHFQSASAPRRRVIDIESTVVDDKSKSRPRVPQKLLRTPPAQLPPRRHL